MESKCLGLKVLCTNLFFYFIVCIINDFFALTRNLFGLIANIAGLFDVSAKLGILSIKFLLPVTRVL